MSIIKIVSLLTIVETFGLYCVKKYTMENRISYILLGIFCYSLMAILLVYALRGEKMVDINVYWNWLSTISALIIGYFLFGEKSSGINIIGVIVVVIGLYLIKK